MRLSAQLVSDVPLCTFLSGAIDSYLRLPPIAASQMKNLHTFSIDYEDNLKYSKKQILRYPKIMILLN